MDEPAVESLRHEAIWSSDIWLVAREVIREAFIENADVHLEQAIEALERWRFIGVIPLKILDNLCLCNRQKYEEFYRYLHQAD